MMYQLNFYSVIVGGDELRMESFLNAGLFDVLNISATSVTYPGLIVGSVRCL